ncbi:hypothetical protein GCM10020254_66530 [Streptomyces goshikiensis]
MSQAGAQVDPDVPLFLAAPEERADPGVEPGPSLVDLVALEELVLGDEEGQQLGVRLGFRDEPPEPVHRRPLVEAGVVERHLELPDAEFLQGAHEGVAPGEVPVEGRAPDSGGAGDLVHRCGRFAGEQGGRIAQHLVTIHGHETSITRMRHLCLIE